MVDRERGSNRGLLYFWLTMAVGNVFWSALPHFLMLFKPDGFSPGTGKNVSSTSPLSSLVHKPFSEEQRLYMREEARKMFYWGYDNYIKYAFPEDELDPIHCVGRGHDWTDPSNININDVLGDYSLTLIDSLDTLAVIGDVEEFKKAVELIINHVSFDHCTTVQVFEATIRILGSLLSAHLLITDPEESLGSLAPDNYNNELLHMAHDLASRLLPAFENSSTGLPHPRVNLCDGIPSDGILETCTAGAGTLTLEFGILSRLLEDPVYENLARKAVRVLWNRRHPRTGLVGNVMNIISGEWAESMSGIGAGIDSFYEYLLKSYILYGEREDLEMFSELYRSVMKYIRKGQSCVDLLVKGDTTEPPLFVNVDYSTGKLSNYWIDSLSASFASLQVLVGDINEAICTHALHYTIWRKYRSFPERFDWRGKTPVVSFYPLRPELVESTYFLYQATQNPFYLHVGSDLLKDLEQHARSKCGYATLHDVISKEQEDRMESFFLSETCKYLYLLFDTNHTLNRHASRYLFTTEGHILRIHSNLHQKPWQKGGCGWYENLFTTNAVARVNESEINYSCPSYDPLRQYSLPLSRKVFGEIEQLIGLLNHR